MKTLASLLALLLAGCGSSSLLLRTIDVRGGGGVRGFALNPKGDEIAVVSRKDAVRVFTLEGAPFFVFRPESGSWDGSGVRAAAFAPNGETLATGAPSGNTLLFWPCWSGRFRRDRAPAVQVDAIACSPKGDLIAVGCQSDEVRFMTPEGKLAEKHVYVRGVEPASVGGEGVRGSVRAVAFSPAGDLLAASGTEGAIALWAMPKGTRRLTLEHFGTVHAIAFSPRGELLASASSGGEVRIWLPATGALVRKIAVCKGEARAVAFSRGGDLIAAGGDDGVVRVFQTASGKLVAELEGHTAAVTAIGFTPRGDLIASGSEDGTVKLWKTPAP